MTEYLTRMFRQSLSRLMGRTESVQDWWQSFTKERPFITYKRPRIKCSRLVWMMFGAEWTQISYRTSSFQESTQRKWKIINIAIKAEFEKVSADYMEVIWSAPYQWVPAGGGQICGFQGKARSWVSYHGSINY
jgi:hypothetical protein